jgi:anaerobic magnesium-protoporphyrin IX monomethyl ester cyclase
VIEMLKGFVAKGIRNFAFIDEMIAPKHFEWLARAIKEAKLDIAYYALTKPARYFTPEIFAMMAESGCKYLLWGLESGNQRVLNLMDKGTKVEEVAQTLARAHAAGIKNHVFMICGFPTETVEEFEDTIRMLDENKDHIYAVHRGTFVLERKSPIFENPERYGITRVWMKQDDASGGRWGYEVASGMNAAQAWQVFQSVLPFLRVFNPYARTLANFRDHALLVYDKVGDQLQPRQRPFPTVQYRPRQARPAQPVSLTVMLEPQVAPRGSCCAGESGEEKVKEDLLIAERSHQ